jgi:hypothetical protein
MKTVIVAMLTFASGLSLIGCAGETSIVENEGEASAELRGGTVVTGAPGLVDIKREGGKSVSDADYDCTGSMIAPNVVLTAAHCMGDVAETSEIMGSIDVTIRYFDPKNGRRIVFDSAVSGAARWARVSTYHYDDDFPGDANDDMGVIIVPGMFTNTDYHDYKRLYDDGAAPLDGMLRAYGAGIYTYSGADDANLRKGVFEVENVDTNHIITDNQDNLNTCAGDSGGPLIKVGSPPGAPNSIELVAGVLAIHQVDAADEGPLCADNEPWVGSTGGDNSAWCRVQPTRINWIQSVAGLTCTQLSVDLIYRRCFALPFIEDVEFEGRTRGTETAIAMTFL